MRWPLALLLLIALPLAGCGENRNNACEECTVDEDCETGLTCQLFRNGAGETFNLCGDSNPAMSCPAR